MNDQAVLHTERAFVSLGSNLGERAWHIRTALDEIAALQDVSAVVGSSLYQTEPMGPQDQPDYLNAACAFDYHGTARSLMHQLQTLERQHGREQGARRWGARPLDLDILLFGRQQIDEPDLQVPHAGLAERSFVLWPLTEIAPALDVPGLGSVQWLRQRCPRYGIRRYLDGPGD